MALSGKVLRGKSRGRSTEQPSDSSFSEDEEYVPDASTCAGIMAKCWGNQNVAGLPTPVEKLILTVTASAINDFVRFRDDPAPQKVKLVERAWSWLSEEIEDPIGRGYAVLSSFAWVCALYGVKHDEALIRIRCLTVSDLVKVD